MAIDSTQATPSGLDVWPPIVASGGGGSVDTMTATASENLAAGALCNIWNNSGAFNVRNADASKGTGYEAHGWTDAAVTSGNAATVRFLGVNTHSSGLAPGPVFLGNVGAATSTAPTTAGYLSQEVGSAESASSFSFEWHPDILLATPTTQTYGGTSQSIALTASGNLVIPIGVTGGRLTMVGGGGGGSTRISGLGGGGGGSAERMVDFPINVAAGASYAVTIGLGGNGAPSGGGSAAGSNGGDTSVVIGAATFTVRGGAGGLSVGNGGAGGGIGGASAASAAGALGTQEAICHFGGSSGGAGAGSTSSPGSVGGASGGFNSGASAGASASSQGGGGGGAATEYGLGGVGGNGGVAGSSAASTAYGAGGGGAGGLSGGNAAGGNGAPGYLLFKYVA